MLNCSKENNFGESKCELLFRRSKHIFSLRFLFFRNPDRLIASVTLFMDSMCVAPLFLILLNLKLKCIFFNIIFFCDFIIVAVKILNNPQKKKKIL